MTEAGDDPLVGTILSDRYRIDSVVGEGSMGRVYKGTHVALRNRLAIKVLLPEVCENEEVVTRFEREAIASGNLSHPNIVKATDFGRTTDGRFFLVLEYVAGRPLFDALAEERPFPADRACRVARQILAALAHAHEKGIVHRDLKPENVVLVDRPEDGEKDVVKILDFGIAKALAPELAGGAAPTRLGFVYGTPAYLSPEQALGQAVDHRADLYGVGVILYEMLTGHRPFEGEDPTELLLAHAHQTPPPPSTHTEVAPAIESFVLRLLEKAPSDRWQDARAALEALEEAERAVASVLQDGAKVVVDVRAPTMALSSVAAREAAISISRSTIDGIRASSTGAPAAAKGPSAGAEGIRGTVDRIGKAVVDAARPVVAAARPLVERGVTWARGHPRHAAGIGAGALCLFVVVIVAWPSEPDAPSRGAVPTALGVAQTGSAVSTGQVSGGVPGSPTPQRSVPELTSLVEAHPEDPALRRQLASAWARAGDLAKSIQHYREALRLDPSLAADPEVHDHLVDALSSRRVWQDARDILQDQVGVRALPALFAGAVEDQRMWVRRRSRELVEQLAASQIPPWVQVAFAIDDARTCEDRSAALARARALGDPRLAGPLRRRRRDRRRADRACDAAELEAAIAAFGGG